MDLNLLPDSERRAVTLAAENKEVTYNVIEFSGYYARIGLFTGLGELFSLHSMNEGSIADKVPGIVVRSSKTEQVSLLLLYKPLDGAQQPFVATRLNTEFFKADLVQ